ncbi:hypothetical protein [Nocardia sp. NPDC051570]|uniref:hypothetical protein n=1 Tax=Nocardia sp. NPDC051570 TaxID=3364324 RepID=UPI0037B215CC
MRTAIVGAGRIGMDLLYRAASIDLLSVDLVIGRTGSKGLSLARDAGYAVSDRGLTAELDNGAELDVIFDASDAEAHIGHWARARETGALMVDLTPSHIGQAIVPVVNLDDVRKSRNINLVSCAGQASIPIVSRIVQELAPAYVEVAATAAAVTVGPATRRNINPFIENTAAAIREISGMSNIKFMAGATPAVPEPDFRVCIAVTGCAAELSRLALEQIVQSIQNEVASYAPGYSAEVMEHSDAFTKIMVTVRAHAPLIPTYAGNLEIINSAAVEIVRKYAELHYEVA